MKIKIFNFTLFEKKEVWNDGLCHMEDFLTSPKIESTINEFCKDIDVVDIKINLTEYKKSASFECNRIMLIYTILYK